MAPKKLTVYRVIWANLDPNLLRIISKKLGDISSFVCFRAVCKRWHAATNLSDLPAQFPWVIDWPRGKGKLDDTIRFYSFNSRKTHTFQVPDARIYGPSYGHLLIYEGHRSNKECQSFLNPLAWTERFVPEEVPVDNVHPIRLGRNLIRNDEPALVYEKRAHCTLYFSQSVNKWTKMRVPSFKTVAFYDHKFFLTGYGIENSRIRVVDEATGVVLSHLPLPADDFYHGYLIATDDGLLAVEVKSSLTVMPILLIDVKECKFEVYRLENYPQNSHWTKLSGIGDLMLFLDQQNGFSLKATDIGGFKGNCIYFITTGSKPKAGSEHVIGRFDMESNTTERIPAPAWLGIRTWERQAAWFLPTLK